MDQRLLEAATRGDAPSMKQLLAAPGDSDVLLGTTPRGNNCLHIASIQGHEEFCKDVLTTLDHSPALLSAVNNDGETPLLTAVTRGRVPLASFLLRCCRDQQLSETILKQDKHGCNALHHAIRSRLRDLALELIQVEPALSEAVNQSGQSPMFIAVMRNYEDVFEKLLEIPSSAHGGPGGINALYAAARNSNSVIAKMIMETRPALASEEEGRNKNTPLQLATLWGRIDVVRVLLEHDRSLGYRFSADGEPLLVSAAFRGHVSVARELLKYCPDAPYTYTSNGWTCLHVAAIFQQTEFVEFVLGSPQLRGLINMQDSDGNTALHLAVAVCNPKIVAALLLRQDIDITMMNKKTITPIMVLSGAADKAKTLNYMFSQYTY